MITIWTYILILFALLLGGWLISIILDYTLAKGAFKLIVGRAKSKLDSEKLKAMFQSIMETRRQKWAFKVYRDLVIFIVGANGVIPFLRAEVLAVSEKGAIDFTVLVDNGIPPYILITALVVVSIVYLGFLYFPNKKYRDDILFSSAKIVNEQYQFIPTQEWFKLKSELSISSLGKKFNLKVNFKYEHFEDAFASTCRDERLARCFTEEKTRLLVDFRHSKDRLGKMLGIPIIQKIENNVVAIADSLSLKNWDERGLLTIENAIEEIEHLFSESISNKQINYDDYDYSNIHSDLGKINNHIHNPWIQSIKKQTLIVYGKGGYGKTHLLAKIVQRRLEEKLPTIFFLGRVITDTSIPMDQILGTLDLKCKKETFYKALDEYGEKHGRVLLVVDGINEGVGLSLWENHLLHFLNEIQTYNNIGLIVSVRTNGGNGWISRFIKDEGFPSYEHRGFEKNVSGAVEYMFRSFSVPLPTWPILNQEFRNPLLLTLFCRAHQGEEMPVRRESRLEIIENYIRHFNERLSSFFHYSSSNNVLQDVLYEIAMYAIKNGERWHFSHVDLMTILYENQTIGDKADVFLDALVDEGLLDEYLFSDDNHFYTFGYDTMSGYLIASAMVENSTISGGLLHDVVVLEALADVLPAKRGKEIFEVLKDEDTGFSLVDMFIDSLPMRTSLTRTGKAFLQTLYDKQKQPEIFEIIARIPFNTDWPLNANVLDEVLAPMKMVERDAIWTINISGNTETKEYLSSLVSWAWSASVDVVSHLDKESLLLICRLLIWTLATTDLSLRDRTTRALVNLLINNESCLLQCIRDYYGVDDDYIVERLFAVAFGCCTGNQVQSFVGKVAQLTYDCIFKDEVPRENILVRDFAKSIIDYAIYLNCNLEFEQEKVIAPYSKEMKGVYVPTEEILKYELNYENIVDKQLYWAQNNIMESMRTEYSSRGMYGDFGRYTFQAALDNWDDNIELVSNFAIKLIFEEIGYDAELFKKFDGEHTSRFRNKNSIERIGKKYQWIAMHRTAALLVDNHYDEQYAKDWCSPVEINVRKFDPTLLMNPDVRDYTTSLPVYSIPEYNLTKDDDWTWMKSWKKMPDIKEYIEYELDGTQWIDLYSHYTISSNTNYSKGAMEGKSEREIWTFIQAFFVDKHKRKNICRRIHKNGLSGRSSMENGDVSSVYYREYYWSDLYHSQIEAVGLTNRDFEVGHRSVDIKAQPSYLLYTISEYSDASLTESRQVIMPSPYLYKGLEMRFSVNDGVWLAKDGNVACFDSYWVHRGHGGLLIRKDLLLDYMKSNNKAIVWSVLMERTYKPSGTYWPRIQAGGYVWMDERGKFHHRFRNYEESSGDKVKKRIESYVKKPLTRAKKFLYNRGLLKMKSYEAPWAMLEIDEDENSKL